MVVELQETSAESATLHLQEQPVQVQRLVRRSHADLPQLTTFASRDNVNGLAERSVGQVRVFLPEDAFKGKGMNAVRQIQWVIIAACLAQLGQQPAFGQVSSRDWLAELKRVTTSMSKEFANSSGHSEIVTTLPLQNREEKKVVLFGRMGTSQISANFAAEPGLVTDANKVAVVTDGVCFWIERDDADPFRVMGITTRAADTDGYYDAVVHNGAGGTYGALGSSAFSLPKHLSDGNLVFRKAVVESANCVRFTFSIPALEMTAEVLFDFAIPGVLEIDTWEKADGSAFREEHRVTYTGNGKGTGSIPESVANNHFYNKELRIGTQTRVLDFEFEAPDPAVFDIRTYGIAGTALPSERTVPRWLMAVIAILVGCGAYGIRRRATAARNLS